MNIHQFCTLNFYFSYAYYIKIYLIMQKVQLYHGKILEKCRKINAPLVSIFPTPVLLSPDLEKKVMQLLIFVLQFATFFVKTT